MTTVSFVSAPPQDAKATIERTAKTFFIIYFFCLLLNKYTLLLPKNQVASIII